MRAVSLRSLKSGRSDVRSGTSSIEGGVEFETFVQQGITRFSCPISVAVIKEMSRDTAKGGKIRSETKYRRKSVLPTVSVEPSPQDTPKEPQTQIDDHTLQIRAYYDFLHRLVEIIMLKYRYYPIPRMLMQIIGLIVPHNRHLTKFTIKQCAINMYTIYELSKILKTTNISDVCLDQSTVREGNYDILLSDASCIRNLSLSRCKINDTVCQRIAARLHYSEPAASTLAILNLSSNHITDVGAEYLGAALRTNRHLRYLNLADNRISDYGADHILDVLTQFPLTSDEVLEKGRRYIKYIQKKHVVYYKWLRQFSAKTDENGISGKRSKKSTSGRNRQPSIKREKNKEDMSNESINTKAEIMTEELLGPFQDPFSPSCLKLKDGHVFCTGNLALCYINLAYNNLSYPSIQKFLAVILHQANYMNDRHCGLLKVILDGNYIPEDCRELRSINEELQRRINGRLTSDKSSGKRRSVVDRKHALSVR